MSDDIGRYADLDAERRYLAWALQCLDRIDAEPLDVRDFYSHSHQQLFAAMRTVRARGDGAEHTTVIAELKLGKRLQAAGGADTIVDLSNAGSVIPRVDGDARVIRELAIRRRIHDTAALVQACAAQGEVEDAREHMRIALDERVRGVQSISEATLLGELYADLSKPSEANVGARTGMELLDWAIGGLPPGSMLVVGGRTGSRKSSLMLAWAAWQSDQGLRPGIVSLEDPRKVWRSRIAALRTGLDAGRLYHGPAEPDDFGAIAAAIERARARGIELVDEPAAKPSEVQAAVVHLIRDKGCDAVYVDYVQAASVSAKDGRWDKAYGEIAKTAKRECKRYGVPLVISSQLKRVEGSNAFVEPTIRDLKETGDLENEAEAVVLLWPTSDAEDAEIFGKLAKLKWGAARPRFRLDIDAGVVVGVTRAVAEPEPPPSQLYARRTNARGSS
jgi:replicative DNA helicase